MMSAVFSFTQFELISPATWSRFKAGLLGLSDIAISLNADFRVSRTLGQSSKHHLCSIWNSGYGAFLHGDVDFAILGYY